MSDIEFAAVMEKALQLSPAERVRLAETLWTSVRTDSIKPAEAEQINPVPVTSDQATAASIAGEPLPWGERMVALLDSLDVSAWDAEDIDDPMAWVERKRQEQRARRNPSWDASE